MRCYHKNEWTLIPYLAGCSCLLCKSPHTSRRHWYTAHSDMDNSYSCISRVCWYRPGGRALFLHSLSIHWYLEFLSHWLAKANIKMHATILVCKEPLWYTWISQCMHYAMPHNCTHCETFIWHLHIHIHTIFFKDILQPCVSWSNKSTHPQHVCQD